MANYRRERIGRLARAEWAAERGIRHAFEREHGKLHDKKWVVRFVCASGLFTAIAAMASDDFHFRFPLLLNALIGGFFIGGIAVGLQVLVNPRFAESLVELAPGKDALRRAALGLAFLEMVVWVAAFVATGIWITHQTIHRGETFIWTWLIQHRS